jgi:hypothetical protein
MTEPEDRDEDAVEDAPMLPDELREEVGRGGGTCYSGRNCSGKVLNRRDAHNCKNSGGKSWQSPLDGTCYNL